MFAIAGVLCFIIGWGHAFPMIVGAIAFWSAGISANFGTGESPPTIVLLAKMVSGSLATIIVIVSFLS